MEPSARLRLTSDRATPISTAAVHARTNSLAGSSSLAPWLWSLAYRNPGGFPGAASVWQQLPGTWTLAKQSVSVGDTSTSTTKLV